MKFDNPYWSILEKITTLQHWVIVHSMLYYKYNESIATDSQYDANCIQLVKYMQESPCTASQSQYYHVFLDFDGSTGFDLESRLTDKQHKKFKNILQRLREMVK